MRLGARMLLLAVALGLAAVPAWADFDCPSGFVPLAESTPVSGTGAVCYQFQIPDASPFVRFQVQAPAAVDLYFREGALASLSDWDRINVGPIQGDARFVLLEPSAGEYTLAVAPQSPAARYTLSATAGVPSGDSKPLTVCSDDGVCSTALPMKMGPRAVELGSKFGDRVIFPLTVTGPGRIEVTATWSGTAPRLALILNGPQRPGLGNPDAAYARRDGASPLTLTYQVTAADVERGSRFQVSLVNFSGGEASGGLDIHTPRTFLFHYSRLASVSLLAPGVVRPREPAKPRPAPPGALHPIPARVVPAKSPSELCAEAVQGKIAWSYSGATTWNPANVERLCKGTTRGEEPARCFRRVMHGGVDWGGSTRWEWQNAIDLCEGTSDADRTIDCFEKVVRGGRTWRDAVKACQAHP